MIDFSIKHTLKSSLNDDGVSVQELLNLLNLEDDLTGILLESLNIENIKNDFINITGAKQLLKIQEGINKGFLKEDLVSSLKDITVYNNDAFTINFNNIKNHEDLLDLASSQIISTPIYSAKNDFFSSFYGMDKYANGLIKNGMNDILQANLELLKNKEISENKRRYRILYDLNEKAFYLRAIISMDRYNNYDNNIAIVIALITLYRRMKEQEIVYSIDRIEYNESYIRIFFAQNDKRKLSNDLGYVKNMIEVSNDEIKREALRFDAISNIEFIDANSEIQDLIIQPSTKNSKIKTSILSIKHSVIPKTFVQQLQEIGNSQKIHDSLFSEISEISKITNPAQIIFFLKRKVELAKNEYIKKHKKNITDILNKQTVTNMIQLLTLFKKIELITENDIEASEYIRFVIYESLTNKR